MRKLLLSILILLILSALTPPTQASDDPPPFFEMIGEITPKRMTQNSLLEFGVRDDPGPTGPASLFADGLPIGASFVDHGDGTGTFSWMPRDGQAGIFRVSFSSSGGSVARNYLPDPVDIQVSGFPLSHGIYRVGYEDGTQYVVSQDHITHTPPLKLDLRSVNYGPDALIRIVASADGLVRQVVDSNTACCNTDGCSDCNNYVRIEHPNAEWTKYTHFRTNSVSDPDSANINVFDCVTQGTFLGYEGDVGHSSGSGSLNRFMVDCIVGDDTTFADDTKKCGIHLHFEVRANGAGGALRLPLICDAPGFVLVQGDTLTAGPCDPLACPSFLDMPVQGWGGNAIKVFQAEDSIRAATYSISGTASVAFFAGERIILKPGFKAEKNSYFNAMITDCNATEPGCPAP